MSVTGQKKAQRLVRMVAAVALAVGVVVPSIVAAGGIDDVKIRRAFDKTGGLSIAAFAQFAEQKAEIEASNEAKYEPRIEVENKAETGDAWGIGNITDVEVYAFQEADASARGDIGIWLKGGANALAAGDIEDSGNGVSLDAEIKTEVDSGDIDNESGFSSNDAYGGDIYGKQFAIGGGNAENEGKVESEAEGEAWWGDVEDVESEAEGDSKADGGDINPAVNVALAGDAKADGDNSAVNWGDTGAATSNNAIVAEGSNSGDVGHIASAGTNPQTVSHIGNVGGLASNDLVTIVETEGWNISESGEASTGQVVIDASASFSLSNDSKIDQDVEQEGEAEVDD